MKKYFKFKNVIKKYPKYKVGFYKSKIWVQPVSKHNQKFENYKLKRIEFEALCKTLKYLKK